MYTSIRNAKKNGFTRDQVLDAVKAIYGPDVKCTIKPQNGEIVVRLWADGKHSPENDYFTDCPDDAKATAEHMCSKLRAVCADQGYAKGMALWDMKND